MSAGSKARRALQRAIWWTLVCGFIVGSLLVVLAGALPQRIESIALWLGLGLMLASVGAAAAYLARGTAAEWRGISPAVGILIGALPFLATYGWHYFADGHQVLPRPPAAGPTPAPPRPPWATWASAIPRSVEVPGSPAQSPPYPPSEVAPLEGALDKLAVTLDGEGRAVARATVSAIASARGGDAGGARSNIAVAQRDLADLQASVERIRSENQAFSEQLDSTLGGTTPIADMEAALEHFSGSAADAGSPELQQAATRVRANSVRLNTWITACNQRIASLKAEVEGPKLN